MKKLFPLVALLSAMALVGCGAAESSASTPASAPATSSKPAESKPASSVSSKSSEAPKSSTPAHAHTWTAGAPTTNADGKALKNSTCTCGAAKVEIAITDASSGASDIGDTGKLGKNKTFTWKFVAPKAGNATLQFFMKYGQTDVTDSVRNTIWGNSGDGQQPYTVKNGETAATVLIDGKTYEETGVTIEGAYVDFATMAVTAGENVVSLTTPSDQYYRNCFINDVALVIA